jgi:Zn-dependent alcohol dehydrogenase
VQGASHAGAATIIAVDPVEFKRASALQFGATHAVASIAEAAELAGSFTSGGRRPPHANISGWHAGLNVADSPPSADAATALAGHGSIRFSEIKLGRRLASGGHPVPGCAGTR